MVFFHELLSDSSYWSSSNTSCWWPCYNPCHLHRKHQALRLLPAQIFGLMKLPTRTADTPQRSSLNMNSFQTLSLWPVSIIIIIIILIGDKNGSLILPTKKTSYPDSNSGVMREGFLCYQTRNLIGTLGLMYFFPSEPRMGRL